MGGTVLVAIGLLVLVAQNVQTETLGLLFLPALGGILTGIGVGAILAQNTMAAADFGGNRAGHHRAAQVASPPNWHPAVT